MNNGVEEKLRELSTDEIEKYCNELPVAHLDSATEKRIKERALCGAGIKTEGNNMSEKKFRINLKAIAALAACVCVVTAGAVFVPKLFGGNETADEGMHITAPQGIWGEFMGLTRFKTHISLGDYAEDEKVRVLVATDSEIPVSEQQAAFDLLGIETEIADDGSLFIYITKVQAETLELPENMFYTQFRVMDGTQSPDGVLY